ncbi:hypothetical protein NUW58_g1037 [Xylaria curta]|uniref:Uncharacterized protein n=1 Tax=Xylaria curta TaxID=42375 RepID=A0ACC1PPX0_9PEZI|nr:hypothetical protein NUW58_g1037 [Xylaria curta]
MDRLNADFAPVDQKRQHDRYCQGIKDLELAPEELKEVKNLARDQLSQTVLKRLEEERITGNRFGQMQVTKDGTVNIGDYYEGNWTGGSIAVSRGNDVYENVSVTDTAFVNIGNNFGGKSPVQIRLEQLQVSRQARHEW